MTTSKSVDCAMIGRSVRFGPAAKWAALLTAIGLLAGCTVPVYRMASKNTPPPVPTNLPLTEPPFEALLHTVIVYRGPGSWKRNAYFDEYVLTVANRGNALIRFETAVLTDFRGQTSTPGTNPWELESISRKLAEKGFGLAENSVIQIGEGVTAISASAGLVAAFGGGTIGGVVVGLAALPPFLVGTIYTNISNHNAVLREFNRRRMNLPVALLPGQLAQGSLFFRISPGPQRLTLKCRIEDEPRDFVIDLAPLAGLHLNPDKKPPAPAKRAAPTP